MNRPVEFNHEKPNVYQTIQIGFVSAPRTDILVPVPPGGTGPFLLLRQKKWTKEKAAQQRCETPACADGEGARRFVSKPWDLVCCIRAVLPPTSFDFLLFLPVFPPSFTLDPLVPEF